MSDNIVKTFQPVSLPALQWAANSLEPVLVGEIIEIHHGKHHKAYVDGYNKFGEELANALSKGDSDAAQKVIHKVNFHSGGHNAHALYWENLAPINNGGGVLPPHESLLIKAIDHYFGGIPKFIEEFNKICADIQGSGWCWLAINPITKALDIKYTEKHDSVKKEGWIPLLTVDVWEHAYYLQYKNLKAEYFKNIWKVINWRVVEERFLKVAL